MNPYLKEEQQWIIILTVSTVTSYSYTNSCKFSAFVVYPYEVLKLLQQVALQHS